MCLKLNNKLSRKELNLYKDNLKLSQEQKDVLVGGLLGDLSLRKIGKYSRLVLELKNKEYLFHLYEIFIDYVRTEPKERLQKRLETSEVKSYWYFSTISHSEFEYYYQMFYKNGKKIIPLDLSNLLTARALAYWFMDDGSLVGTNYNIATCCFTLIEQYLLKDIFINKYNIFSNIYGKENKYILYIRSFDGSNIKFKKLIEPYIIGSMKYKLNGVTRKKVKNNNKSSLTLLNFNTNNSLQSNLSKIDLINYKLNLKINNQQINILIGNLLGHFNLRKIGISCRLVVELKDKEYLSYLYNIFKDFIRVQPKERIQIRGKNNNETLSWIFSTISHSIFENYYIIFYKDNKKIIPLNLNELINAEVIAYWYMSNGNLLNGTYHIKTYISTLKELELIKTVFIEKFNIKIIFSDRKNYFYISADSSMIFKKLIESYILDFMKYKL